MYTEKAEAIELKLERNKERLNNIRSKIIKLQLDEVILEKKIRNQETYLLNIQAKVEEERETAMNDIVEQLSQ